MIKLYQMSEIDWFGYQRTPHSGFSYHHLLKAEDGGKLVISNGAILTKNAHDYLHIIEQRELEMYVYLNNLLTKINEQGFMPTKKQYQTINRMLKEFESLHRKDRTQKNQKLIKQKYLVRKTYQL